MIKVGRKIPTTPENVSAPSRTDVNLCSYVHPRPHGSSQGDQLSNRLTPEKSTTQKRHIQSGSRYAKLHHQKIEL